MYDLLLEEAFVLEQRKKMSLKQRIGAGVLGGVAALGVGAGLEREVNRPHIGVQHVAGKRVYGTRSGFVQGDNAINKALTQRSSAMRSSLGAKEGKPMVPDRPGVTLDDVEAETLGGRVRQAGRRLKSRARIWKGRLSGK